MRVYQCIRVNGGWNNWIITVLEEFQCHTKMEKTKKERSVIEQLQSTLNEKIPANHQTGDQYDIVEWSKAYRAEHNKKYIHCHCCNHMINLVNKSPEPRNI